MWSIALTASHFVYIMYLQNGCDNMFSEVLKQLRQSRGMSQEELAEIIGVSKSTIGMYEQGNRIPKADATLKKIAEYFKISLDALMGFSSFEYSSNNINVPILEKYTKLNSLGQEKADSYISDLLENPKYVADAHQIDTGYASIAADTGKNVRVKAPDIDTIIALNKDEQ